NQFDRLFDGVDVPLPPSLIETGSMVLIRELLRISNHLGFISRLQTDTDLRLGAVQRLQTRIKDTARPIGLTLRAGWRPTRAQREFLNDLRQAVAPEA